MKNRFEKAAAASAALFLVATGAAAQNEDDASAVEEEDVIVVRSGGNNPAMDAFRNGDFALAEIEFDKNARCAHRVERNRLAAIDQIQSSQVGQTIRAEGFSNGSSAAAAAAAPPAGQAATGFQAPGTRADEPDEALQVGTCTDRGFQLYMAGLSKLQLGKVAEAKRSFERATSIDKNLYDAHYRLGLMRLLEGDEKGARRQLKKIETVRKRCRDCDVKDEIDATIASLEAALSGEMKLR